MSFFLSLFSALLLLEVVPLSQVEVLEPACVGQVKHMPQNMMLIW